MKQFQDEINEVYEKSLHLAQCISSNLRKNHRDHGLITHIKRNYQEIRDLQSKHKKNSKSVDYQLPKPHQIPKETIPLLPQTESKEFMNKSLEESNHNIKLSRSGKRTARYSENLSLDYASSYKNNHADEKPLPHVYLLSGKTEEPLDLPGYKNYAQKIEEKNDSKALVMEKIDKCEKSLRDFYKSLGGIELFCANNPGVPWNNDKKVLHRLHENPNYKASIIRAYNDSILGSKVKTRTTMSKISLGGKKYNSSRTSLDSNTINYKSHTPAPAMDRDLDSIAEERPATAVMIDDPEVILDRCSKRFLNAKYSENQKLINIFTKLKKLRPWYLKKKTELIMHDSGSYRNKISTLHKFDSFKRKIDSQQEKRLKKSKSHAKIYTEMLDYLISRQEPKEIEVNFTNLIRKILGEGWNLTMELINSIFSNLSEDEVKDLDNLLNIIKKGITNRL